MAKDVALDRRMMRRALREAMKARPSPNPRVGAVVARGDEIISVGHHAACGGPHAEVVALSRAGERARGATLYVTLEPCNHVGRTGPCTDVVIAAGVSRVVAGCADPLPHCPGGPDKMRAAGIEFTLGLEEDAARALIAGFASHRLTGLPRVTLKAALTLDGRMAARSGDSKWITGPAARKEAHRMRAHCDAVLVGVGTVLADDPELTVRLCRGPNPLRVVLDSRLRLPTRSKLAQTARDIPTLIIHGPDADPKRHARLSALGVELASAPLQKRGGLRPRAVVQRLARRGVLELLLEGGAKVHGAFLDAGLVDEVALFYAPKLLGDARATPLADGAAQLRIEDAYELQDPQLVHYGPDWLIRGPLRSKSRAPRSAGRSLKEHDAK